MADTAKPAALSRRIVGVLLALVWSASPGLAHGTDSHHDPRFAPGLVEDPVFHETADAICFAVTTLAPGGDSPAELMPPELRIVATDGSALDPSGDPGPGQVAGKTFVCFRPDRDTCAAWMDGTPVNLALESVYERHPLGEESLAAIQRLCADAGDEDPTDPCKLVYTEKPKAIDHVRGIIHRSVCATALWFDNLFGDARAFDEAERTYGLVEGGGLWKEGDGVDGIGRLRIKWRFPAMSQKLSLIVGRLPEERISAEQEDPDLLPEPLDKDEQEFVVGVESEPVDRPTHRISLGGGVTYRDSLEPYVKVRSRSRWLFSEKTNLHLRVTPYWQDGDRDFGIRSTVDLDTQLRPQLLMRWTVAGVHDGLTNGTRYAIGPTLYHQINDTYFMVHRAGVAGEAKAEIPDRSYGFVSSVRRSLLREWLFVEVSAGIDWRRETRAEQREPIGRVGIVFEMHFGGGPPSS